MSTEITNNDGKFLVWELKISRVANGYILDDGGTHPPQVIEESETDELYAHEQLLWRTMEHFNFQGSTHDMERLYIVRKKNK